MWKLFNLWCGIRSANLNNIHRCFFLHTLPTYSQCSMIGAMVVLMNTCIKSTFPVLSKGQKGEMRMYVYWIGIKKELMSIIEYSSVYLLFH